MVTPDPTMQQLLARTPVSSTPLNFGPEGEPGVDVGLPATNYSRLIGSKSPARAVSSYRYHFGYTITLLTEKRYRDTARKIDSRCGAS